MCGANKANSKYSLHKLKTKYFCDMTEVPQVPLNFQNNYYDLHSYPKVNVWGIEFWFKLIKV